MKKTKLVICLLIVLGVFFYLVPFEGLALDCSKHSLQKAINRAHDGDTISVTGTCNENIVIPETLNRITLDGQGSATIIGPDSDRYTVYIIGREIRIQGFTIRGGMDGIGVVRGGTARIENNIIQYTGRFGIGVIENSYAEIIGNTIQNNPSYGILINENSSARIGFTLYPFPDPNPNTIQNNDESGIFVTRSSNAQIVGNKIRNNGWDGITVVRSSRANISNNEISANQKNGILVWTNSGVDLGEDTGTTIFELPNYTTDNNSFWGIRCSVGGYVDGRRGTLIGGSGVISADVNCIDTTVP